MNCSVHRGAPSVALLVSLLAIGVDLGGCASLDGEEESSESLAGPPQASDEVLQEHEQSILHGSTVTDGPGFGLVQLPGCSGILLSANLVLTAAHCVSGNQTDLWFIGQHRVGDVVSVWTSRDLAAIAFDEPVLGLFTNQPWQNLYWSTRRHGLATLAGRQLQCYGRGPLKITNGNFSGNASGTYFSGTLDVWSVEGQGFRVGPGPSGQILTPGDSGGPCFFVSGGSRQLAAINSSAVSLFYDHNANGRLDPGELAGVESAWLGGIDATAASWIEELIYWYG